MRPETEAFLEVVREAENPTAADERRVLAAVHATVAAGALLGTAAASSKLARLGTWCAGAGFKSGAAAVVLVAAAAGGVAAVWSSVAPSSTSLQARGGAVTELAPASKPAPIPASPATPKPAPALTAERAPTAKRALTAERAPKAEPAPKAERALTAEPAPEADAATASLRDELAALARAQAALRRGDGALALSALEAPSTRPPELAAERATLRILALCAVGRSAAAREAASALERQEPGSLQRDVISRSCAGGPSRER